jgi:hypothetical protein
VCAGRGDSACNAGTYSATDTGWDDLLITKVQDKALTVEG